MLNLSARPPIQVLPGQLADQIAAGEVIERPASVVKELVENSLDAGAAYIEIDIEQGGCRRIHVSDDGHGIASQQLPLAMQRHATSKIARFEDLQALHSLGFRGEALASIASVSQWRIISRVAEQDSAYEYAYDHQALRPATLMPGTRVEVDNLFYNTPARRKFLRSEQTEYRHIDELVRRIALSRFDVGFSLRHNQRQIHKLAAARDDVACNRRVSKLCGQEFINNSVPLDITHHDMRVWGWLGKPDYSRQQADLQYFYINGRIIRDRVINHALRQAYNDWLYPGRHACFVLHFEVDPALVDINVHPTKHEARFREARMLHDFLQRSVYDSLGEQQIERLPQPDAADAYFTPRASDTDNAYNRVAESMATYQHERSHGSTTHSVAASTRFGEPLIVLQDQFLLTQQQQRCFMINIAEAVRYITQQRFIGAGNNAQPARPLLIPEAINLRSEQLEMLLPQFELFRTLGFELDQAGPGSLRIRSVPVIVNKLELTTLFINILQADCFYKGNCKAALIRIISQHVGAEARLRKSAEQQQLLQDMQTYQVPAQEIWCELQSESLQQVIKSFS